MILINTYEDSNENNVILKIHLTSFFLINFDYNILSFFVIREHKLKVILDALFLVIFLVK